MERVKEAIAFLQGKKTYLIVAITFILGGLNAVGVVVPEWVYIALSALGLGALRAGVSKSS